PVWLAASTTGPSVGTCCAPTTRVLQRPWARNRPIRWPQRTPRSAVAIAVDGATPRGPTRDDVEHRAARALEVEHGRVDGDDAVGGDLELRDRGVVTVPPHHRVARRLDGLRAVLAVQLTRPPGEPRLLGGRQQDAHVRGRRDDGRDVTPLGDDPA